MFTFAEAKKVFHTKYNHYDNKKPNEPHFLLYIKFNELLKYVYDCGGCINKIFKVGFSFVMIWEVGEGEKIKNFHLMVFDSGEFNVHITTHIVQNLNIFPYYSTQGSNNLLSINEGINHMRKG